MFSLPWAQMGKKQVWSLLLAPLFYDAELGKIFLSLIPDKISVFEGDTALYTVVKKKWTPS